MEGFRVHRLFLRVMKKNNAAGNVRRNRKQEEEVQPESVMNEFYNRHLLELLFGHPHFKNGSKVIKQKEKKKNNLTIKQIKEK